MVTRGRLRENSSLSKPRHFALRFCIRPNCGSLLRPFAYARIIGESEHRGGRKLLKIFHIEPVYEAHEIFHHLLHAIMDTLSYERGPPPVDHHIPSSPTLLSNLQADQERMDHDTVLQEISLSDDSFSDSEDELPPDTIPCFTPSVLQADIIESISNLQIESGGDMGAGVHIISVIQEIQLRHPNITAPEFFAATEQLLNENLIHTTIDDEHYTCRSSRP